MSSWERISIILPVYNAEKHLKRCIESVLNQTYTNWELIIINNGSTDNSGTIIKEYENKDKRIRNIKTRNYQYYFHAENVGLQCVEGECISFINSDNYYECDFLEKTIKNMRIYNADISICNYRENEKNTYYKNKNVIKEFIENKTDILFEQKYFSTSIFSKVYKADLFEELCFDESNLYADLEVNFKVFKRAKKIVFDSIVLYNSNNIINQKFDRSKLGFISVCDKIERELKDEKMKTNKLQQLRRFLYIQNYNLLKKQNNEEYQADLLMLKRYLWKNIFRIIFDSSKI